MTTAHNRVCLGTFPLSGVYNPISSNDAENLIRYFFELGGYYIDTAPMYGCGKVESLLGKALSGKKREDFYIISKCGKEILPLHNTWTSKASYHDVIKQCHESLQRLKLDYLDLYLIHSPDKETPFDETVQALLDLQKSGKINDFGVSNVTLDELKKYREYVDIRFVQNRFSFVNRSISDEYLLYLKKYNIQLLPYEILEIGQLTGSIIEEKHLGKKDVRGTTRCFQDDVLHETRIWIKDYVSPLAKKNKVTIGQLIIAWTLNEPQIPYVLVGTTKKEYLTLNLAASSVKLTDETKGELETAYKKLVEIIQTKYHASFKEFRGLNDRYYSQFDFKRYNIF